MSMSRKDIRKKPAIGGRGGRLNDTSMIIEELQVRAKKLSARNRVQQREVIAISRELAKLEVSLGRLAFSIGGTRSVTLLNPKARRRRHRGGNKRGMKVKAPHVLQFHSKACHEGANPAVVRTPKKGFLRRDEFDSHGKPIARRRPA